MKKYIALVMLTVASGIISGIVSNPNLLSLNFLFIYSPGIIFGIIMGVYFWKTERIPLNKIFSWALASTFAYFISCQFALSFFMSSHSPIGNNISLSFSSSFVAGFVGAMILAMATNSLIKRLDSKMFLVALIGGIIGLIFKFYPSYILILYVVWQTLIGLTLTIMVNNNDYEKTI